MSIPPTPVLRANKPSRRTSTPTPAPITCDNVFTLRELLRNGGGIGRLPAHLAEGDVEEGNILFRDLLVEQLRRSPLALATRDGLRAKP